VRSTASRSDQYIANQLYMKTSVDLTIGMDILQGGRNGVGARTLDAELKDIDQQLASQNVSAQAFRLQTQLLLIDLYIANCKQREFRKAKALIDEIVSTTESKYKARLTSYTSLLDFQGLERTYARQLADSHAEIAQIQGSLISLGETFKRELENKTATISTCEPNIGRLESLYRKLSAKLAQPNQNSVEVIEKQAKIALTQARVLQTQAQVYPSLEIFGGVEHSAIETLGKNTSQSEGLVGVKLVWDFPFGKSAAEISALRARQQAEELEMAGVQYNLKTRVRQSAEIIPALIDSLKVNLSALDQNQKHLNHLSVQMKARTIDSVSYSNVALQQLQARTSLFDQWGTIEKRLRDLSRIYVP
jgi:outer membrane protein TolC